MGPLGVSAKQHREYLKLQSQNEREVAKMQAEEQRKQQLHDIKLKEAAAKANQGIGHKEDIHAAKLKELGSPLGKSPKMNKQKLGIPTQNPMAGTGMFKQGQRSLKFEQGTEGVRSSTDTVPAMLTPGEAVIPAPAAQDPKNKKAIQRMVEEGRQANDLRDGVVPSLAYEHPDEPGSSFVDGSVGIPSFNRGSAPQANYNDGTESIPKQIVGYADGTEGVGFLDKALNFIAGQKPEIPPVIASVDIQQPRVDPNEFFRRTSYAEANNNPYAKQSQPGQTAAGLTGTTKGTFGLFQKKYPELQGVQFGSKEYSDPKFQEKLSNLHVQDRTPQITNKGLPVNYNTLYAAGFGPNGINAYAGKDDEPLTKYFTKEELKNNKYFGNTVGEYKLFVNNKMDKAEKQLQKYAPVEAAKEIPGGGFATNAGGAAFGNPTITREAALSVPRQQSIARGEYVPIVDATQTTPAMKEKYPQGIPMTPNQVAQSTPVEEVPELPIEKAPSLLETKPEEANKTIAEVSKNNASIIQGFLNDPGYNQIQEPEQKKSWLEKAIASVYGPTGVFSDSELARFAVIAAGGLLTGGSVGGSLKYAGLDALKSADARRAAQATRSNEELKNTRELKERLDSDYRTALGENIPAGVRAKAVELWQGATNPEQQRAVIQLLKMNKSTEDTTGSSKPGNVSQGFFDGKPINFRNQAGNVQRVNSKGEWENIPPAELKRFETEEARTKNVKQMIDSNVNRLTPVLKELNKSNKNYRAEDEAKRYAEAFALIKEDLGPNISPTSFAKMSENTINSAFETAKATGGKLTEEGLRKQFFGNAVIETKMVTGNKEMYMAKDSKGKFTLPAAPYQTALGTAIDTYKQQGIDIGTASNAIENKFNNLPSETKKKFTQMSAGAPGSTPMLLWLQQTGGTN